MIRRLVAVMAGVAVVLFAGAAPSAAQDGYSDVCAVDFTFDAPAAPNAVVDIAVTCDAIVAGEAYFGILQSTPVQTSTEVASQNGRITFPDVTLPGDWDNNATHTLTLFDADTGRVLGAGSEFVDASGRIGAPPGGGTGTGTAGPRPGGALPRTGVDTGDWVRAGVVLVAVGGAVVLTVTRRRPSSSVTA